MKRTIFAAAAASIVALLAFLTLHAIVIVPIWWRALGGLPFVLVPSLAIAPAFHLLVRRWWQGMLFGAGLWLCIVPSALLKDIARSDVVSVVSAAIVGLLLALAFRRDWRAAAAGALAGAAIIIASAGPLSIFRSARALRLFFGLLPVCVLYGLAIAVIALASSAKSRPLQSSSAQ